MDQTIEQLPSDHYRVRVSYEVPPLSFLEKKFSGPTSVSRYFAGACHKQTPWIPHDSCWHINETPGERVFRVAEVPPEFLPVERLDQPPDEVGKYIKYTSHDIAAHFDAQGYRFAVLSEAIAFADAQPELQLKNSIFVLGTWLTDLFYGSCYVPVLWGSEQTRRLDHRNAGSNLYPSARLLLVRK